MNKKILLVAMGLLAIFTAFAKDCPKDMPSLINKGSEFARENRLTCLHKEYYENGKISVIGSFKNGKGEGEWKWHRLNGNLEKIGSFKNGKQEGEWKLYYENGKLKIIENFKNGKQEGEWKIYYENGKLHEIGNYKNGFREGEWKGYHKNGNLYQIGNFKNGQKEGEWNIYNKNGKPLSIEKYVDGKTKEITGKLSYVNFNITEEKRVKQFGVDNLACLKEQYNSIPLVLAKAVKIASNPIATSSIFLFIFFFFEKSFF